VARAPAHHPRPAPARADRLRPRSHRRRMRFRLGIRPAAELRPRAGDDSHRVPRDVLLRDRHGRLRARAKRRRARGGTRRFCGQRGRRASV
jgi:hypothetical protein